MAFATNWAIWTGHMGLGFHKIQTESNPGHGTWVCPTNPPPPRWGHSAVLAGHDQEAVFLVVFGTKGF